MPLSYVVDHEQGLIRTRCDGRTTFAEVLAHFDELSGLTSLPARLDVFLDLSGITSLPTLEQLEYVARTTAALGVNLRWGIMAIVVSSEVAFGTSRIYDALVSHYFQIVRVFRDAAEAEAWMAAARALRRETSLGTVGD